MYRPVSLHVSAQSSAGEPSFEGSDIFKHATEVRLSSEQPLFQHGETKIGPLGGDLIQLRCQLPLVLGFNLNNVFGVE